MTSAMNKKKLLNPLLFARFIAALVMTAGVLVIIGWVFDVSWLKSLRTNWVTMKFTTALSFVLSGLILFGFVCRDLKPHRRDLIRIILPAVGLILFVLVTNHLLASLMGVRMGAESLLIVEAESAPYTVLPGRPSLGTMGGFLLVSLTPIFCFLFESCCRQFLFVTGLILMGLSLPAVLGYLTGIPLFYYYVENFSTAMALHTAVLFLMLGTGYLALYLNGEQK